MMDTEGAKLVTIDFPIPADLLQAYKEEAEKTGLDYRLLMQMDLRAAILLRRENAH